MMFSKSKAEASFFILMIFMLNAMPPITHACGPCTQPHPPYHRPGHPKHPPHHGGGNPKVSPPQPPVIVPPIIITPPILPPPVIYPPPTSPYYPPAPPHQYQPTCPIDALKLGLCLDVLGGLVHIGIANPVENVCCPVIQGLLDLEAAICLCTIIRARLLNLNIFIPLSLQVLITCGKTPPPGFVCSPL
ncbi:putative bifunctional inhibitor/plant lipid transfer protein/seed storage helical [Lupinus albus]|uniref:Putative bifunctional inhibitor/plant lipid transfer protein/seed storage helical n=1 Tax=Lupinus albus TaxID=3870 RepID=A0A6A4QJU5_LUPAL|nr:putative bifunctional inhibitor/plant lipid transfer protein/seed storage helical [Lupinus albus]